MIDRALLLLALALVVAGAALAVRAWSRRQSQAIRRTDPAGFWSALGVEPDGRPALVVFSTPACVACRTAQAPAVDTALLQLPGSARLMEIDIGERPDVARAFRVLTAPSTAVLAADGRVSSLNHGYTPAERLVAQLSVAGGARASRPS